MSCEIYTPYADDAGNVATDERKVD